MGTWAGSPTNWPSLLNDSEYYVDVIAYTRTPLYFRPFVDSSIPSNSDTCTTEDKILYKMYPNKYAGASFIYTISRTVGPTKAYTVTVSKIVNPQTVKPEDLIRSYSSVVKPSICVKFGSSEALGHYLYQSCIGFYVSILTRQGGTILRAPRWSGDFNYGIHCACTGASSLGYNARCNVWNTGGSDATQPFIPKPVEALPEVFDKNFRYIADVMDSLQSITIASDALAQSASTISVFEVLSLQDPQTPWLNNPLTWSVDS